MLFYFEWLFETDEVQRKPSRTVLPLTSDQSIPKQKHHSLPKIKQMDVDTFLDPKSNGSSNQLSGNNTERSIPYDDHMEWTLAGSSEVTESNVPLTDCGC
ncbi:hypothetical protein TNIN_471161 [Trichonephila inaurata madagascariensis]|uniref:Uncharacterized protein n=1 Tax=Trichonephila inaurata madagascariensis TaxID=2747483 RepID=A0A8X6Y849_9ARAC|nr:hypothetical protein TNIN_471161 [Trichonephila inaurata madagascariensis]